MSSLESIERKLEDEAPGTIKNIMEDTFDDLFRLAKSILKRNVPGKENDPDAVLRMVSELNKERQYLFNYSGGPFGEDEPSPDINPI